MLINDKQFDAAMKLAATMSVDELQTAASSGTSRSYYVRVDGKLIPLKAVTRLAYKQAGLTWDKPQSRSLAASLRDRFPIEHITDSTEKKRVVRQREVVVRWARPGQTRFRLTLLGLYGFSCVISGCRSLDAIDGAHVQGVDGDGEDVPQNGMILRADLHRLFDANLMAIDPKNGTVHFSGACLDHYANFEAKPVKFPAGGPTPKLFAERWAKFKAKRA